MDNRVQNQFDLVWSRYLLEGRQEDRAWLLESYLPLVRRVVGRMDLKLPGGLDRDDLVSLGVMGLMQAVDRFCPDRGVRFETFALQRIRGAVIDGLRRNNWVPRGLNDRLRQMARSWEKMEKATGSVSPADLAREMGTTVEDINQLMAEWNNVSFLSLEDCLGFSSQEDRRVEMPFDPMSPDPQEIIEQRSLHEELVRALGSLEEKDRIILNLYYYEELTLKEIAKVLGISEARVSQLRSRALLRLRQRLQPAGKP